MDKFEYYSATEWNRKLQYQHIALCTPREFALTSILTRRGINRIIYIRIARQWNQLKPDRSRPVLQYDRTQCSHNERARTRYTIHLILRHCYLGWSTTPYTVSTSCHLGGILNIRPREAFLGFKRDLRCGFGDYMECSTPDPNNSTHPSAHRLMSNRLTKRYQMHITGLETRSHNHNIQGITNPKQNYQAVQ